MDRNKRQLLINSLMLYAIIFSNYFFSFITMPYQTRILGPEIFGKIGFATAIMIYFQLFMDFGFLLSGTEEVSKNREDTQKLSEIYSSIIMNKLLFCIISLIIFLVISLSVDFIKQDFLFYFIYLLGTIINTFLPDYLYRGLEDMKVITYRTVLVKFLFTICIFIFLKKPSDYIMIPILNMLGNLLAVLLSLLHVNNTLDIKFIKVKKKLVFEQFNKSKHFFFSRIVSTVYTATNTVIIKIVSSNKLTLGYFTAADKLMATGKSALTPISDSVYPYMIKNKDFKLIKKILIYCMPIIVVGTGIVYYFAEEFCLILLGKEYGGVAPILRALLPIAIITLPEYLFGFPTLGAMGLSNEANKSIYFGTIIYLFLLVIFWYTGNLNVIILCLLTSFTEFLILLYRIVIVIKNKKLLN